MNEDTTQLYQDLVMARARSPHFAGRPAAFEHHAQGENPICGDHVEVFVGNAQVRHESRGCAILLASADLMAQAVAGKTPAQVSQVRAAFEQMVETGQTDPALGDLNALAGLWEYRSRIRCATLPWAALEQALGA